MSRSKGGISLKRLLEVLQEEGATDEEAEDVIEHFVRRRQEALGEPANPLARVGGQMIEPTHTPTLGPSQRPVDYGNETAAEARERWEAQERADPQGVFSGGSSAGGIFGDGAIATDTYDPAALKRTVDVRAAAQSSQVQHRTLEVLERVMERLGDDSDDDRPQVGPRRPDPRQLGRRRK
jgi:hypothetical protein